MRRDTKRKESRMQRDTNKLNIQKEMEREKKKR